MRVEKAINKKGKLLGITVWLLLALMFVGCNKQADESEGQDDILSDNVIITETGEIVEKENTEVNDEEAKAMTTPKSTLVDAELLVEPEQEKVVTQEDQTEPQGNKLQLVFLGDSIFDNYRDGTGVPYRTGIQCEADYYNLAIGGTTAAVARDEQIGWEEWTSRSLVGMVNAIAKNIPTDIFENDTAKTILDNPNVDFSKTDYFIVEYGMNDFLCATPLSSESNEADLKSYAGALRYAVVTLKSVAPDATIILCAPTYAQFYNGEGNWMIGDGNSINNGYGTLFDYKGICEYVANEKQVLFFNAYQNLGINGYTAEEYLEDGIHLTDEGRQLYADALTEMILENEETKNN